MSQGVVLPAGLLYCWDRESLVWELPPTLFFFIPPSFRTHWSSLVYLGDGGNSGARRTLKIDSGPTVGPVGSPPPRLPGQPASFLCCLDQSLADGLYNDDCHLGRLQTTSNSWRFLFCSYSPFPLLSTVPFLYKWLHVHIMQQRDALNQYRRSLVSPRGASVPGRALTAQPTVLTAPVVRPQPPLSHQLLLWQNCPSGWNCFHQWTLPFLGSGGECPSGPACSSQFHLWPPHSYDRGFPLL